MSEVPTRSTESIQILGSVRPSLPAGRYLVSVTQSIRTLNDDATKIQPEAKLAAERPFVVGGPRYTLAPDDVVSVFPPEGSLGAYEDALPHVVLRRVTLPWERGSALGGPEGPWLALLLFDAGEAPIPQTAKLADLRAAASPPAWLADDGTETATEQLTIIDVKRALLAAQIPSGSDLRLLAHVRQPVTVDGNPSGEPSAVVIGRRLPRAGGTSVVHLVSLDRRAAADFAPAGSDTVRLVSLKQWTFACADASRTLPALLKGLDRTTTWLRLPPVSSADAESWLGRGYVPLTHRLRTGRSTVSFYRGPLSPDPVEIKLPLPVRDSDALLCLDPATGLLDASYAAAWELGRLLAIESADFAKGFYAYRREQARARRIPSAASAPDLPIRARRPPPSAPPDAVKRRLDDWRLLRGIPFRYLVPDTRMLPSDSIRFFHIDGGWMRALLDGCFSVGRVLDVDVTLDVELMKSDETLFSFPHDGAMGIILRSEAVAGWPALQIKANDAAGRPVRALRVERLSPSIILGLFEATIAGVVLWLAPEGLHFGFDSDAAGGFVKKPHDAKNAAVAVPVDAGRVVDVGLLADRLSAKTAERFAAQMLLDTPIIQFQLPSEAARS